MSPPRHAPASGSRWLKLVRQRERYHRVTFEIRHRAFRFLLFLRQGRGRDDTSGRGQLHVRRTLKENAEIGAEAKTLALGRVAPTDAEIGGGFLERDLARQRADLGRGIGGAADVITGGGFGGHREFVLVV